MTENILTKRAGVYIFVFIWIIFSVGYIITDIWSDFKTEQIGSAYIRGQTDTVIELIRNAENKDCKSFSVYKEKKQIELINVECLKPGKAGE